MELNSAQLTVSLPYPSFAHDLGAILDEDERARVRLVDWSFKDDGPHGVEASEIDMVVLPFHTTADETTEQYVSTRILGSALTAATGARLFQAPSIGVEGLHECIPPGAPLGNAAGVMEQPTAELAVTLLLSSARELRAMIEAGDDWANRRTAGIVGSRVLLLGYGGVGTAVERMLAGFDVELVRVASRARLEGSVRVHGVDELPALLPDVDAVVCTLPLSDRTRGLVDAEVLRSLRDGAIFVNVGRGPVVDTDALLAEADTGRLFIAVDVTDPEPLPIGHPLWTLPNVIVTPHIGGNSNASHRFQAELLAAQVRRLLAGDGPLNVVPRDPRPARHTAEAPAEASD